MSGKVQELEEEYQSQKVLSSGTAGYAEISELGWEVNTEPRQASIIVYFQLKIPEQDNLIIGISPAYDPKNKNGLIQLYNLFGQSPERELNSFSGESFEIQFEKRNSSENVVIKKGGNSINASIVDDDTIDVSELPTKLPQNAHSDIVRSYIYEQQSNGMELEITDLNHNSEKLEVKLNKQCGSLAINMDTTISNYAETNYERLIENIGQGMLQQVQYSKCYITHESDISYLKSSHSHTSEADNSSRLLFRGESYDTDEEALSQMVDNFVLIDETATGWWIISGEPVRTPPVGYYVGSVILGTLIAIMGVIFGNILLILAGFGVSGLLTLLLILYHKN